MKERITKLFRKYNLEGSATQQFVCRYFDTKNINDLNILRIAKLDPQLRKELTNMLRDYFKTVNAQKKIAPEGPVQEQQKININQLRLENGLKPIPNGEYNFISTRLFDN